MRDSYGLVLGRADRKLIALANSKSRKRHEAGRKQQQCVEHVSGSLGALLLFGAIGGIGLLGVLDPIQDSRRLWIGGAVFVVCLAAIVECLLKASIFHSGNGTYGVLSVEPSKDREAASYASDDLLRASDYPPDGRDNLLRPAGPDSDDGSKELVRAASSD